MPFLEFVNPLLVFVIVACHKFLTLRNMDLSFRRLTNTETAFMINKCVLYVRICMSSWFRYVERMTFGGEWLGHKLFVYSRHTYKIKVLF